jgi:hypothetical protein
MNHMDVLDSKPSKLIYQDVRNSMGVRHSLGSLIHHVQKNGKPVSSDFLWDLLSRLFGEIIKIQLNYRFADCNRRNE